MDPMIGQALGLASSGTLAMQSVGAAWLMVSLNAGPMYVALIRVGEASGSLDQVLEVLAAERMRAEAMRRKVSEAIRYPLFILVAAACVLTFFLTFVLPQFASVLHDLGAKIDPTLAMFLSLSCSATMYRAS